MKVSTYPRIVDDVTVRLVAAEVLAIAVVAAVLRLPWIFALLAADFIPRTVLGPKASPLAQLASRVLRPRIHRPPQPTPGPPKRFAAAIGAVFTVAIPVTYYLGAHPVAWVMIAIMIVFPILEAGFGLCVGCRAFALLMRWHIIPEEVCLECADISLRRIRTTPAVDSP